MDNPWANKTALEILDDLKALVMSIESRPKPLEELGTISIDLTLEQWERLMWYGWWPDMPPALDMWRWSINAN